MRANTIYVVEDAKIDEHGTDANGFYVELFHIQFGEGGLVAALEGR